MKRWVADFETTTDPDDCRVWAWGIVDIDNVKNFRWGKDIDSFLTFLETRAENGKIWMHNLKFDAQFIISKLLTDGWEWTKETVSRARTFTTLITPSGDFYSIKIVFKNNKGHHKNSVEIFDSLKLINFSVAKISQAFKLNIPKMDLDYEMFRPVGYEPSPTELGYLNADCMIVASALKKMFDRGVSGITIGQAALNDFRKRRKNFGYYFPELNKEVENDIRQAYKGGFTYLNPIYREIEIGSGFFLDKNSMYPEMIYKRELPIGAPVLFEGKLETNELYKLFVQKVSVVAKLKEGKIPFLRSRTHPDYDPLDYICDTKGEFISFTLTNLELDLLFENYDVEEIVYHRGWKFRASEHIFDDYVEHWTNEKERAKANDDPAGYVTSKMYLNSLVGKFGGRNYGWQSIPQLDENGVVNYTKKIGRDERKSVYSPIALFTTAHARVELVRTIQKIRDFGFKKYGRDVYVYSDTDSIATTLDIKDLEELEQFMELDDKKMGAWKLEKVFCRAKFLHSKCYMIIDYDGIPHATVAGMPKELADKLSLEKFETGFSTSEFKDDPEMTKLRGLKQVIVKGGAILRPTDYTL